MTDQCDTLSEHWPPSQPPTRFPALRLSAFTYCEPDRKEAVDQGERAEKHYQNCQGNPWPDKGAEAKQHGNQATQGHEPPVADYAHPHLKRSHLISFFLSEVTRRSSPFKQQDTFSSLPK